MRGRVPAVRRLLLSAGGCALASGCMVGPTFHPPAPPAADHYLAGADPAATIAAEGSAQRFDRAGGIPFDWWTLFRSAPVNDAIRQAIANSPRLASAQAKLRESQHDLEAGYGVFFPAIGAGFDATRQKYSPARLGQSAPASIFNLFTLSATISYTLDIFGGNRRGVEELKALAGQQQYVVRGTYLTLATNIANDMIASAAYREEIERTRRIVALETEQVDIAEARVRAGNAPYSSVLSLRSQLASVESTLPQLEQKLAQANDLLATLTGRTPADGPAPDIGFADISLPETLPLRLPSDLLRQRPDILAAEAAAHAASADIGVATAAMLPSLTLSGGYGTNSNAAAQLFKAGTGFWSMGGSLATPLIQGGSLWYKRKAAVDRYDGAMADYRETVLEAFAQVSDVLQALQNDARALEAEQRAVTTADQSLALIKANYAGGLASDADVLIADAQLRQTEIGLVEARAARYQDTVALFAALGGGWWADGAGQPAP